MDTWKWWELGKANRIESARRKRRRAAKRHRKHFAFVNDYTATKQKGLLIGQVPERG